MSLSLERFTCPHCLKDNATLFDTAKFIRPLSKNRSLVFTCRTCDKSLIIDLVLSNNGEEKVCSGHSSYNLLVKNNNILFNNVSHGIVERIYPKPNLPVIPEHLSPVVSKNTMEAKELFQKGYFNQSAMTARRAIDLATKELLPDHTGMLNGRIKQLLDKHIITQQLYDWADIIRLDGNSANHDYDDFTEEQAKQLLDFTEMFLMYAFTLPKMVEIKRRADN